MNAGGAVVEERLAQLRDDVDAKGADALGVVGKAFEALADPAGNLGAAVPREARKICVVRDRHDAGEDRFVDPDVGAAIEEIKVGVDVVEILGDCRVRTRVELALEVADVGLVAVGLRMDLGVGTDFDVEVVPRVLADEGNEFVGVNEARPAPDTRGKVAP